MGASTHLEIAMRRLAAALFATCLATTAHAGDQDFKLVNKTGYQIDSVYVSEASRRAWGRDIMGRDALAEDESVDITFNRNAQACRWDLKVRYNDGDEATWQNLNLCNISRVTLFWNDKTQKTTAKVD